MSETNRETDLKATEAALGSLVAAPASVNRDLILFRAGQVSVRGRWLWPAASGVMTAVAAALALVLVLRSPSVSISEAVYVQVPAPSIDSATRSAVASAPTHSGLPQLSASLGAGELAQYRAAQNQVLRWGLDAVPSPRRPVAEPKATGNPNPFAPSTNDSPSIAPWFEKLFHIGDRT